MKKVLIDKMRLAIALNNETLGVLSAAIPALKAAWWSFRARHKWYDAADSKACTLTEDFVFMRAVSAAWWIYGKET